MLWYILAHGKPDFIRVKTAGSFDLGAFAAMIEELVSRDDFVRGARVLFGDRALDLGSMTNRQLFDASNTVIRFSEDFAFSKIAVLVAPASLSVGRRFYEITRYGSRAVMEFFDNKAAAHAWLCGTAATTTN